MKLSLLSLFLFVILTAHAQSIELVMDISEGPSNGMTSYDAPAFINGMMVFAALNEQNGKEPFIIRDGVLSMLKDLKPGSGSSNPSIFFNFKNEVYFMANTSRDIWKTDGSENGTSLVISFADFALEEEAIQSFVVSRNDKFYFTKKHMMYVSDGTQENTFKVPGIEDISIKEDDIYASLNADHFNDGIAFLTDRDSVFQLLGAIDTNVTVLGQINLASQNGFAVLGPFEVERGLIMAVRDGTSSIGDLYLYDKQTEIINKFSESKIIANRINRLNDDQLLITTDNDGNYITDGTKEGTIKITTTTTTTLTGRKLPFVRIGNSAFFHGDEQITTEGTYATGGTVSGTRLVINTANHGISNFISNGPFGFWITDYGYNDEPKVWAADIHGSGATLLYTHTKLDQTNYVISPFGATRDKIYFVADLDDDIGKELYSLDHNLDISGVNGIAQINEYQIIHDRNTSSFKIIAGSEEILKVTVNDIFGRLISSTITHIEVWNQLPPIPGSYCITIRGKNGMSTRLVSQ